MRDGEFMARAIFKFSIRPVLPRDEMRTTATIRIGIGRIREALATLGERRMGPARRPLEGHEALPDEAVTRITTMRQGRAIPNSALGLRLEMITTMLDIRTTTDADEFMVEAETRVRRRRGGVQTTRASTT